MTTTQTTHTTGTWTLRDQSEPQGARYTVEVTGHGLRSIVADIRDNWLCEEHGGTAEANARLIAAAPALLAALKLAAVIHPYNVTFSQAIALAEGTQP